MLGIPLGALLLAVSLLSMISWHNHRRAIDARVEKLKAKYHLSESQTQEVLKVERSFHAFEYIFSFQPKPTDRQKQAHRAELKRLLGVESLAHNH